MKYTVKYLPSFSRDLNKIAKALEEYPTKAMRLFKEMDEKLLLLKNAPKMYPIFNARPKYRKMTLEDHLLFYTLDEQSKEVKVCHILYARVDIPRYLRK